MIKDVQMTRRAALTAVAGLGGTALLSGLPGAVRASAGSKVVVELFTSQACPKCPPANDFLAELAKEPDVIALCLPVGIWDFMGWKENNATPTFTERQVGYAQRLDQRAPFTPQMVIGGQVSEWGTRRSSVIQAIRTQQNHAGTRVRVELSKHGSGVRASIGSAPFQSEAPASIYSLALKSDYTIDVAGGANKGKTFAYPNMVTSLHRVGEWTGKALNIVLPRPEKNRVQADGIAVIVQEGVSGPILGADLFSFLG